VIEVVEIGVVDFDDPAHAVHGVHYLTDALLVAVHGIHHLSEALLVVSVQGRDQFNGLG
jgi:hypothetical protein